MGKLDSKIPDGPLAQKWTRFKATTKLVNPANKKKLDVIIVGTGISGAGAASALGEQGYNVKIFCYQDSPRRCPVEMAVPEAAESVGTPSSDDVYESVVICAWCGAVSNESGPPL